MKTSQKEKEYQSNQWRKNIEEHHNKKTCSCHKNQAEVHPIWFIGWLSGHSETTKTHDNLVVGILLFTWAGAEESAVELCIFALASAAWLFAIAFYKLPHFLDCLNFGHPQRLPFHNRVTGLFPTKISWRGQFLQALLWKNSKLYFEKTVYHRPMKFFMQVHVEVKSINAKIHDGGTHSLAYIAKKLFFHIFLLKIQKKKNTWKMRKNGFLAI